MTDEEMIYKYVSKSKQKSALKKLRHNYPIQYIIGTVDFYNSILKVNKSVLIPRFETEYLVEKIIKRVKKNDLEPLKILELGTGSGCISIALKKELNAEIDAIDISRAAIRVAKYNAKKNNVSINFMRRDMLDFNENTKWDLIISNPPYVGYEEEVDIKTKYEPQIALFAKEQGLQFYNQILKTYKDMLKEKYLIAFEIGSCQGTKIMEMAKKHYPQAVITLEKDLNNKDRYIFISNNE